MDALSDILDLLKFNGSLYFTTEFTAPWGIQVPKYQNVARFHLASGGDCWVNIEGVEPVVFLNNSTPTECAKEIYYYIKGDVDE